MQGTLELALFGLAFVALQLWWLSRVLLGRPRQPKLMGKSTDMLKTLRDERKLLERIFSDR